MKRAYLLTLLSITACSSTSSTWQSFALDQRVSVKLPHQPHLVEEPDLPKVAHANHPKVWRLFTESGDYQLMRTVYPGSNFAARDTAYYTQMVGFLKKAGAHDITLRRFLVANTEGREFTYYTTDSTPTYIHCFALDSVRYAALFFPARQSGLLSTVSAQRRDEFFNSVTVKP